jgi:heme/copper-type cytochrome/quinol oxidase subunit 2
MTARPTLVLLALVLSACSAASTGTTQHEVHLSSSIGTDGNVSRNELTKQPSAFSLVIASGLAGVQPGQPTTIAFSINRDAVAVKDFKVAHEKLLHFIVVRNDLTQFQHLHPDLDSATGRFRVAVTFAEPGTYALFADFEPQVGEATVLRKDITVGSTSAPTTLTPNTTPQTVDGYTVTPSVESPLPTGTDQMFIFGITNGDKPVTDLQNYLGAKGHAVILREGTLDYLHAHPSDHGGGHGGMVMPGPGEVIFMASLPSPGRYRVFQQYRPEGHLITVANTYEVISPPSDISTGAVAESDLPTTELSMQAFQWGFSPNTIHVKEGTRLMIHLTTRDVAHGFSLAEFDVSETILPGKTTTASFVADKKGTFTFGCDIACGSGHEHMSTEGGTLVVE